MTPSEPDADGPLLAVEDLRTHVHTDRGTIHAVDGVDFEIDRGETVCLVGESGSGKSVTSQSITGIVPRPPAEIRDGRVVFDGTDLLTLEPSRLRSIRGDRIAHVFQNPQHSLDPVYTVGEQVIEAITIHQDVSREVARARGVELFRKVGIPKADERFDDHPHQFSGGMRQRVAIAIALASDPDLLIADEPTTAVDVTVQARLIELLRGLSGEGMAVLWITHDLRVVSSIADRVLVMFGGTIVERGPVESIFARPAHPYTQALFDSYRGEVAGESGAARVDIPTDGCRYRGQCPHAVEACAAADQPPFFDVGDDARHQASCVYYGPEMDPVPVLRGAQEARPVGGEDDD